MNPEIKLVSLEGNIGSGKSSLYNELKRLYGDEFIFIPEPVATWESIKDENETMLEKFYRDKEKYSFPFQMMAYISRLTFLMDAMEEAKERNIKIIITERTLDTDKHVFAKMLHDDKKIEEVCMQIYNKWFDTFKRNFKTTHAVYVKTDPLKCLERISLRNRHGESGIPIEYLNDCASYHDAFIREMDCKKLILDNNEDYTARNGLLQKNIEEIILFIKE